MSNSSNLDHSSEVVIGQNAEGLANTSNTPFSEVCSSQAVSDSVHSYLDFDFPDEMILGTNQVQSIGQQTSGFQNEIPYYTPRNDTPMPDWLRLGRNQNLHQHNAAQFCEFIETERDDGACDGSRLL
ncbi:hypothetical protein PTT_10108 [Pyrenophora teres f. teres 0-1]|uniref:Uncharacterized protein n=1 Tax=Pyrenophora teres f. teres (strain 0-1) TaxID=861557 RepID=E3RNG3_PYRTT|nr:hypothetical protein PTT_10108 [Pyrenophora teres f. teres 0-1]